VLELERWQLQEEYTRLLLELNTWAAPHRISQIASDKLFMLPPALSLSRVIEQ
jgi:cell division protein FtsL